jgi:uncharacterized protein YbaR (Trm112 family)
VNHPTDHRQTQLYDRHMLEALVCPVTAETLHFHPDRMELHSPTARLAYPIRDGVPVMLPDEARSLD